MAPLRASLELFDAAGIAALRTKSERMTAYLLYLVEAGGGSTRFEVITPRQPARRGGQISLLVHDRPRELLPVLQAAGVVADFREPNIVRAAVAPLYNTYRDIWQFAQVLKPASPTG
jgi:kynureninase